MKIYYVEDEIDLANIIKKYLEREGYDVSVFYNGEDALPHIEDDVSLWILDIMLTGEISGYDLIKKIKEKKPNSMIIFTSARDQDLDKIMGLELGSDDYLAKPFSPRELILRVKAVLKRTTIKAMDIYEHDGYIINLSKREVIEEGIKIDLTHKEFELLEYLLKNTTQALSRETLLSVVWGENYYGSDRVVDDLLRRLRQKMPNLKIETIYGFGYKLL